jgi:hypothetical protein
MMIAIAISFVIASILNLFYLFLQRKKAGKKLTAKDILSGLISSVIVVAIGYLLRQGLDRLEQATGFSYGSFILSVIIPACMLLWYKQKPNHFQKRQKMAILLLCNLLVLIFITPILG